MDRCRYCGHSNGQHGQHCPEQLSGREREAALFNWKVGYDDGRAGRNMSLPEGDHAYQLGWTQGDSAADEAANSVPWST